MGDGNVGIGTDNPLGKFQVGEGFNKINIVFLSGDENSDCITSYLGFNAAKTSAGWVFNTNGTHNGGAVIMASSSGQLNFIIKRNPSGDAIGTDDNCSGFSGTNNETLDNTQIFERTKMIIDPFGKVGIGTTVPMAKLHLFGGDMYLTDQPINNYITSRSAFTLRTDNITAASDNGIRIYDGNSLGHLHIGNLSYSYIQSYNTASIGPGTLGTSTLDFDDNTNFSDLLLNPLGGNVGIGTTAVSGAKLSVEGIIRARRVLVNNTWADYVFETNYQLMPLADLETYITTKKHLPNVPTAQQVEKDGVDLGEINKILVEKVEELTLYIININRL